MSRHHGFVFTINNYTDNDIADVLGLSYNNWATYIIAGFEVGDEGTPHIQGYLHCPVARTLLSVSKQLPRSFLCKAKAIGKKFNTRYEYCMKTGNYWEYGIRPVNGQSTVSQQVIQSINDGISYNELSQKYPSYILHHGSKVKAYIDTIKQPIKTRFYVIDPLSDTITEVYNYFSWDEHDKVAVITDLTQLQAYDQYDHVIYFSEFYDKLHSLWPRGAPITYKYGYQQCVVKCHTFIISTSNRKLYSHYRNI